MLRNLTLILGCTLLLGLGLIFWSCGKTPVATTEPGTLNFDSGSYCDNHPAANGCCREEKLTTINFDDVANNTLSPLGPRYDVKGITFSSGSNGTYVVSPAFEGHGSVSGNNALIFGLNGSLMSLSFFDPSTHSSATTNIVSAQVGDLSDETDMIIMKGYGLNGLVVAADTFISQPTGKKGNQDFGEIRIEAEGIARVTLTDTSYTGADLDDLSFGCLHFKLR